MSLQVGASIAVATTALLGISAFVYARQSSSGAAPKGPPKAMDLTKLIQPLQETGYQPLFDGKTMNGWDGDPKFWRVEDGALVGQTTVDNQPKQNTFLIWRGGSPGNFELKLEFRLIGFNSGIQYRSIELPDIKWAMKGYQADMDGEQRFTGQIYEERGRGFLALRGQYTYIGEAGKPGLVGSLGGSGELKNIIKSEGWNDLDIIARGNTLTQLINSRVMSMLVDDDTAGRKMTGLIGIQVHKGPSMKIEVRNIRIKNL
jgi:Domain of Unknown Function (DUF1080)